MPLRVITWNVWWRFGPWEQRQAAIEATLAEAAADVICLQETWVDPDGRAQAVELGERLGLHAVHGGPVATDGPAIANAVLARWPIVDHEVALLPDADGAPSRRHAVLAHIRAPFGPLRVVSTHLHHPLTASPTRVAQAAAVAELVARHRGDAERDYPVIVGGDLNSVPYSDEIRSLTGAAAVAVPGLAFTDCWDHAGDGGPGLTWTTANPYLADATVPNRRIDYLLVSWPRPKPLGNPTRCWVVGADPVGGVQASDHYGVAADLVTPA
jgi:endonuclease/exonuclease/phosphatase family metal-dependent hydrolase